MRFIPKTVDKVYLMLLYIVGFLEFVLMIRSIIKTEFKLELIESIWNLHLLMLFLFILMVVLFYRYLVLTVGKTVGKTQALYDNTKNLLETMANETLLKSNRHFNEINNLLANGQVIETSNYLSKLVDLNENHESSLSSVANPALAYLLSSKAHEAKTKGITISYEISSKAQLKHMNVKDLIVILGNLLDNAIQASVENDSESIKVTWLQENNQEVLTVENYSRADIKDALPRLFEVGYTTKKDGGGGNGLPIVKKLITKNHGQIHVVTDKKLVRFIIVMKSP
ncbi:sensor histidine kinase [Brevibacillus sp. NRS-1366]|uniref:sensor histidine kinase n=1 Tax=Brevibacillus sp. NRS-1366 TaxID=3233899 RepID=UPI003D25FD85